MPIQHPTSGSPSQQRNILKTAALFVSATLSFLVLGLTNDRITAFLEIHRLLYVNGGAADPAKSVSFFVNPLKSLLFFVGTTVLLAGVLPSAWRALHRLTRREIGEAVGSFAICVALIATLVPSSYGRFYARISTAPFDQLPGDMYRRLLMPGLAYIWHLDGFLYTFFFWAVVFLALLLVKSILLKHGFRLSILEGASLLTTGIFMTAFQTPGYPEIIVFLLALVAWNALGEPDAEIVALAGFALALMAHEASAAIIFAPLLLFFYKPRVWGWACVIGVLYLICVGVEFAFDFSIPARMQTTVSSLPASVYFKRAPLQVAIAALSAYKLLWVVIVAGVAGLARNRHREAGFVMTGLALAIASTYLAVDYTRMIALATLPLLTCLMHAKKTFPPKLMTTIFAINLLCPCLLLYGNAAKPFAARGGYSLLCKALRIPVEHL